MMRQIVLVALLVVFCCAAWPQLKPSNGASSATLPTALFIATFAARETGSVSLTGLLSDKPFPDNYNPPQRVIIVFDSDQHAGRALLTLATEGTVLASAQITFLNQCKKWTLTRPLVVETPDDLSRSRGPHNSFVSLKVAGFKAEPYPSMTLCPPPSELPSMTAPR